MGRTSGIGEMEGLGGILAEPEGYTFILPGIIIVGIIIDWFPSVGIASNGLSCGRQEWRASISAKSGAGHPFMHIIKLHHALRYCYNMREDSCWNDWKVISMRMNQYTLQSGSWQSTSAQNREWINRITRMREHSLHWRSVQIEVCPKSCLRG